MEMFSATVLLLVTLLTTSCHYSIGFQIAPLAANKNSGMVLVVVPRRDPPTRPDEPSWWFSRCSRRHCTVLGMSTLDVPSVETQAVEFQMTAKDVLLDVANKYKDEFGLFLVDTKAKKELTAAVESVEATFVPPMDMSAQLIGTWDLVSTTSTTTAGIDTSTFLQGPLKQLTDKISSTTNRYVTVQQIIKADDIGNIYRVDHVLAYKPPSALTEFFDNLPTPLATINVNPLDVSNSKIILVHKAVQSGTDPAKISLTLSSVILNVAGNSTYLDPAGKDITSINLPLTEFLGGGEFTTTYVDEDVRVSRGKQAGLNVLRVFSKRRFTAETSTMGEEPTEVISDAEIIAAVDGSSSKPSDVEA